MADALILVAGGAGTRMGSSIPKQFMLLGGKPLLIWTLEVFHATFPDLEIILVLSPDEIKRWEEICSSHKIAIPHTVVSGGENRSGSVFNGLNACKSEGIIAVHDAVRPLVSKEIIRNCFFEASEYGTAIPSIPLKDTIRRIEEGKSIPADREQYRLIQTPQCFKAEILRKAYADWNGYAVTDDAGLVELSGHALHLCRGEATNIKITEKADLLIAESILNSINNPD